MDRFAKLKEMLGVGATPEQQEANKAKLMAAMKNMQEGKPAEPVENPEAMANSPRNALINALGLPEGLRESNQDVAEFKQNLPEQMGGSMGSIASAEPLVS